MFARRSVSVGVIVCLSFLLQSCGRGSSGGIGECAGREEFQALVQELEAGSTDADLSLTWTGEIDPKSLAGYFRKNRYFVEQTTVDSAGGRDRYVFETPFQFDLIPGAADARWRVYTANGDQRDTALTNLLAYSMLACAKETGSAGEFELVIHTNPVTKFPLADGGATGSLKLSRKATGSPDPWALNPSCRHSEVGGKYARLPLCRT